MKKLIVGLVVLAGFSGLASAEGNAERGEELTASCAGCHGADGNSAAASFPKLAGQGEAYLLKQLEDVKNGNRVITQMSGILDDYDQQQLEDIAAYYAEQSMTTGEADPELVELGEQLYRGGNPETGVPACSGCHNPAGQGIEAAGFPRLAGQHADYIASQLNKFAAGYRAEEPSNDARKNDGESGMMQTTAFRLKDFEIEALASYINGLHQ